MYAWYKCNKLPFTSHNSQRIGQKAYTISLQRLALNFYRNDHCHIAGNFCGGLQHFAEAKEDLLELRIKA